MSGTAHVVVDVFGGLTSAAVTQQALGGNLYALQWGYTQLGAPYAAINPYRFGDSTWGRRWECPPGWGGCAKVDMHGGSRTAATGAWVYDCSGFVVAAFQRAGVDLVRLNAGWSDAMFKSLPRITRAQAIPGDLLLFGTGAAADPTSHVGMYLGGERMLNATTGCGGWGGVCETVVDWTRVVALSRAPLPGSPSYAAVGGRRAARPVQRRRVTSHGRSDTGRSGQRAIRATGDQVGEALTVAIRPSRSMTSAGSAAR